MYVHPQISNSSIGHVMYRHTIVILTADNLLEYTILAKGKMRNSHDATPRYQHLNTNYMVIVLLIVD